MLTATIESFQNKKEVFRRTKRLEKDMDKRTYFEVKSNNRWEKLVSKKKISKEIH
jgi:hypothetical protein